MIRFILAVLNSLVDVYCYHFQMRRRSKKPRLDQSGHGFVTFRAYVYKYIQISGTSVLAYTCASAAVKSVLCCASQPGLLGGRTINLS